MRLAILFSLIVFGCSVCPADTEKKIVAGFNCGLAAGKLPDDYIVKMAELPLQDLLDVNNGRYTFIKDDGISGHWGLDAIKSRVTAGTKPYELLRDKNGVYQTERVIFADTGTGATMMMLTQLPYSKDSEADELNYFGKSCWNADGSKMVFSRSKKPSLCCRL